MTNIWDKPDLLIESGSRMYGCSVPSSDIDIRGFVVEPGSYLIGRKKFEQYENKEKDIVIWGIRKFFSLLEKGSPNTIEILFAPPDSIKSITDIGKEVIDSRNLFVSRKLTNAIRGFASSEWRKTQLLTKNKETGKIYFSPRVVGHKRKESHEKYGYCLKNAYHSIRLLEEGIELLNSGTITFPCPNAGELIDIRSGVLSFEEISAKMDFLVKEFSIEEEKSNLPVIPCYEKIDRLYLDIISEKINLMMKNL